MPSLGPAPAPAGSTGGRYRPIARIGRGGMAEALLAMMDAGCGARRLVVLKRIWPELASDPEFMTMFMDEARLSVRLDHPNLVRTFEVISDEAGVAMAMEYLDGQPLTRVLNRLRGSAELSVAVRLRIVSSVLAGLEHAHELADLDGRSLGVVHRDVSPHNVFVTYDGQVKLVDFGVAKTLASSHHTRPGALKGKLAYMAPEQLQPEPIDRRADLFAAGVMLWELLSGKRMWQGMTEVQIVTHLSMGLPFPSLPADAGLPAGLDAICARALDPDPAGRYQTAADMELDLARIIAATDDSHARQIGKLVTLAFATERADRQALIEESARAAADAEALPLIESPAVERDSVPSVEVTLSAPGVAAPAVAEPAAPAPRLWFRRVAAAALVAAGMFLLVRAESARPLATPGASPAPAASAPALQSVSAEATPRAPRPIAAATTEQRAERAGGRHRRHHSQPSPDEDATLPPTIGLDGPALDDPPLAPTDRDLPAAASR
ncbi:MAG TPA: serine/threonine-protein kinase [Polyangia bacterium]|nr:serine/threonine-protein kinase [Polyangia bacterium]